MKKILAVCSFALLALSWSQVASASSIATYYFTSDHCTGGCLTGQSYGGTVQVTESVVGGVDSLSFLVTLLNGNEFVSTGFAADFGFSLLPTVGGPTITYSGVSAGWAPVSGSTQSPGSLHMDGTGFFEYGLTCTACGSGGSNPQPGPLAFTISASGLSLASLQFGSGGELFAADVISGTTGKTGAIDASVTSVPDGGATAALLGSALLGLGVLRRKLGR